MSQVPAQQPQPDIQHYLRPGLLQLRQLPPLTLYVHLPWCLKKCPYCDFNSHEWRAADAGQGADLQSRYIDALLADLQASLHLVWGRPVFSVFLGGGTPSLFAPEQIARLLSGIRALLPLQPGAEISMEANPGTFEAERFAAFAAAGITRLSIGVQSFNDAHLHAIGRVHNAAQARTAVAEAARAFASFNIDLMYALPGQSLADLRQDLQTALDFAPPHLSVYHLTVEPNTWFAKHPPALPDEDVAWDMLDTITEQTARAGLARYEVSAYARSGQHCVHNLNYWQFGDYLGLGAGAHGKLSFAHRIVRQVRHRQPQLYMDRALAGNAVAQEHEVPRSELAFEYMLNALRLKAGFALEDFSARTGLPPSSVLPQLQQAEQAGWLQQAQGGWQPTARGFDFLSDLQSLFLGP